MLRLFLEGPGIEKGIELNVVKNWTKMSQVLIPVLRSIIKQDLLSDAQHKAIDLGVLQEMKTTHGLSAVLL